MKRLMTIGIVGLLALAGCGGAPRRSSSTASSSGAAPAATGGGTQLKITADAQQLKFNTTQLSAKAGTAPITMTTPSPLQHDVSIKGGLDVKGNVVGQGGKSVASATLKPGKYTFYCSVDGHESAGMTGELDVN